MTEPRRDYSSLGPGPYTPLQTQLAETLGRIGERVDAETALRNERIAALAWCRANGNPHLKDDDYA
jgi:hypothetical protein